MSLINIIIAVNAEQIANQVHDGSLKPGTLENPTSLGWGKASDVYIAMIAQSNYAVNEQGKSELEVKADSGDTLRWSITSFDSDTNYTPYLYNGVFNPSGDISTLQYLNIVASKYLPTGSDPRGHVANFHDHVYIAQGTVLQPGKKIQYVLAFTLIQNSTGKVIGHFSWDPYISVSP